MKKMIKKVISDEKIIANRPIRRPDIKIGWFIGILILLFVLIWLISASIINVPAGNKAVVVDGFGVGHQFDEGWQFKNPLSGVENVRYNTQYQKETISILTNDGYNVPVDVQIVYHLEETKVGTIRTENPEYKTTIIMNQLRSKTRVIVADWNYTGEQINTDRAKIEVELENRIRPELATYYIALEAVNIRNVDLPQVILDATEARQGAKINVQTQEYNLQAKQFEAQQKVVNAWAEFNVTIIEAESFARANQIWADQLIGMNVSENKSVDFVMFMKWVHMLESPDSNVKFYIIPEGVPIIMDASDS